MAQCQRALMFISAKTRRSTLSWWQDCDAGLFLFCFWVCFQLSAVLVRALLSVYLFPLCPSRFPARRHMIAGASDRMQPGKGAVSLRHLLTCTLKKLLKFLLETFRSKSVPGRRRANPLWMRLRLYSRLTFGTFYFFIFFLGCFPFLPVLPAYPLLLFPTTQPC